MQKDITKKLVAIIKKKMNWHLVLNASFTKNKIAYKIMKKVYL